MVPTLSLIASCSDSARFAADSGKPQDAAIRSERDAATSYIHDASVMRPDAESGEPDAGQPARVPTGISFQPLATLTADAQTVAHMELTGLLFLPGNRGVLVWEKTGRVTHYALNPGALTPKTSQV